MDIWRLRFVNVFQPLCPCLRKHLLHACLCVTVSAVIVQNLLDKYRFLGFWRSACNFSRPLSVLLSVSGLSSCSPLFRAFVSFWNILSMLIRCGLLVTSAPPTTLRGTHGPLFWTPSLIKEHSPAGFGRHVSPGDLCGVIMYSRW